MSTTTRKSAAVGATGRRCGRTRRRAFDPKTGRATDIDTAATIGGETHTFDYDADGNITEYDCTSSTCVDDKYIDWNGRNLPARITVGDSKTDPEPTARDEFAYGPDGARYHRT